MQMQIEAVHVPALGYTKGKVGDNGGEKKTLFPKLRIGFLHLFIKTIYLSFCL